MAFAKASASRATEEEMMKSFARAVFALVLLGSVGAALSACNTVAGAGDDLHNGARDVQQHL
jgi:predicted small secreted protein